MRLLARFFASLSAYFESKAIARKLGARVEAVEARQDVLDKQIAQLRLDMGKLKFVNGLNQLMDVTPD